MKKPTRRIRLTLCTMLALSALSTGCDPVNWAGPNWFISLNIPLGLGGTPGLLNPFGIVQALVNAALGAGSATDGAAATSPTPPDGTNVGNLTGALGGTTTPPSPTGF